MGVPNPNADADALSGAYATILKNEGFTKSEDANNDYMGVWGHRHSGWSISDVYRSTQYDSSKACTVSMGATHKLQGPKGPSETVCTRACPSVSEIKKFYPVESTHIQTQN